jgi:hypothetical protein
MFKAIAQIAAPIVGGLLGKSAADKAASGQQAAADAATAEQRRQFDITREDQAPWLATGQDAIRTLGQLLGLGGGSGELMRNFTGADLANDPGYAFRLAEGNKAIENAARARGMYMGPSTVKELLRYGQDYAGNEFQNAWNRDMANRTTKFNFLSGASGGGQTAANTLANAGASMANNIGSLMTGAANARGAARIAGANALAGGLTGAYNNWSQGNLLDRILTNGGFSGTGTGINWGNTGSFPRMA